MRLPFRIPVRAPPSATSTLFDHQPRWLAQRSVDPPPSVATTVAAVVIGVVLVACFVALVLRSLRHNHAEPKYIPTPFLKRLWSKWSVPGDRGTYQAPAEDDAPSSRRSRRSRVPDAHADFDDALDAEQQRIRANSTSGSTAGAQSNNSSNTNRNSVATVDRNTSVRSVMTLPAYRVKASDGEEVLGVEGERDGIDVVVEMPTAEEEEAMRDEEMDALYQIRLARRRQIAEREERRRLRRDARDRNDVVALQDYRTQARAASGTNTAEVEELRREHERIKETRQRAVSSVSYADLGIARHDGTRIRANSSESERVGLLSDAGSIAVSARSPSSLFHRRDRSASSVLSIDTNHSGAAISPALTTGDSHHSTGAGRARSRTNSRTNSRPDTPRAATPNTRAGSSPEIIDAADGIDLGDTEMPPHSPPGYDDVSLDDATPVHSRSGATSPYPEPPPDYLGPTQARNDRLSAHVADLVADAADDERQQRRTSRGVGGIPQLPSLRLNRLPQIVIEPSSALPRDDET